MAADKLRGFRVTRQGMRVYNDVLDRRQDPRGRPYYWIGGSMPSGVPDDGTDIGAISKSYVSITPLHLDLTEYRRTQQLSAWSWKDIEPAESDAHDFPATPN
jgi:5'-nucleotidase